MKYKGSYFNMWDAWYLNHGETVHAFHLKSHAGDNWNVGHVYTKDLLHFHKMRDVLETLPEEQYPDDCLGKFTGCAVENDGTGPVFPPGTGHGGPAGGLCQRHAVFCSTASGPKRRSKRAFLP